MKRKSILFVCFLFQKPILRLFIESETKAASFVKPKEIVIETKKAWDTLFSSEKSIDVQTTSSKNTFSFGFGASEFEGSTLINDIPEQIQEPPKEVSHVRSIFRCCCCCVYVFMY